MQILRSLRSSRPEVFDKKGVLRNFIKFTGKHLCQSLFFNRVAGLRPAFLSKKTLVQVFSCKFCKISKNTVLTNTSKRMILEALVKYTYSQRNITIKGNSYMLGKSECQNFLNWILWKFSGSSKQTVVFDVQILL